MEAQRDSKSYAVKIFFRDGHNEQIKFSSEKEMNDFAGELDAQVRKDLSGNAVELVTLLLEDGTNIRVNPTYVYFFKSFKMTRPRGNNARFSDMEN